MPQNPKILRPEDISRPGDYFLEGDASPALIKACLERLDVGDSLFGEGYDWRNPRLISILNHFEGLETVDAGWQLRKLRPWKKKVLELNLPYLNRIPGGLGDHMVFSHIPKFAKEIAGYDEVVVRSEYRKEEYKRFLFEDNPFVDRCETPLLKYKIFTKEDIQTVAWREYDVMVRSFYPYAGNGETANYFDIALQFFNFSDGRILVPPYLHYQPKKIPELEGRRVFDPNYYSAYGVSIFSKKKILGYLKNTKFDYQLPVLSRPDNKFLNYTLPDVPVWKTSGDLEDLCDVIHSSGEFWGFLTGSNVLAYALGKPIEVLIGEWKPVDNFPVPFHYLWLFPNIHNYRFF